MGTNFKTDTLQAEEPRALVFDVKRDSSEDGPGIRTTVFFKGCPLDCIWCQNPEGKSKTPGLFFDSSKCRPSECSTPCAGVCETGALRSVDGVLEVNREECTRCDRCFELCPTKALRPAGHWIGMSELLSKVLLDRAFYKSTGGGVTVSGGEATMQMDFLHSFLKELKREGIHTAIETSGCFDLAAFKERLLPYLDLVYFDIKLISESESRRYMGVSNKVILENFTGLIRDAKVPVIPRIPLIPGVTATEENLTGIAGFLREHSLKACSLMPYNPLWHDKAKRLGLEPLYGVRSFMSKAEEDECLGFFYRNPSIDEKEARVFDIRT